MIELGSKVKDTIMGMIGIAVSRTEYLNGCARVVVQPPVDKDGKIPESGFFDELQLQVLAKPTAKIQERKAQRTSGVISGG